MSECHAEIISGTWDLKAHGSGRALREFCIRALRFESEDGETVTPTLLPNITRPCNFYVSQQCGRCWDNLTSVAGRVP